jgi:exodeoxyribonuclease VII large subunit
MIKDDAFPIEAQAREVLSISQLNQAARRLLETGLPMVWVEGEISNLARPSSGHIYFTLKDASAQVRCAMFKMKNRLLDFRPSDGQQVLARVRVSIYEARGDYQLIIEHMEEAGDGALRRQFELLKHKLQQEGLFDAETKQALPELPRRIGIITSPTGAAIRDILSVLKRRFPAIPVLIYPIPVQGAEAPPAIVQAIQLAAQRAECDLLVLTRGGGSLEDLWAFNDEAVARAVHDCPIPLVSAVGHEIDFTIADFVADVRAPTPSAAAELISPDRGEWLEYVSQQRARLVRALRGQLQQRQQTLHALRRHIKHPGQRLRERAQRLDELEQRLMQGQLRFFKHQHARIGTLQARLQAQSPVQHIRTLGVRLASLQRAARHAILQRLKRDRQRLLAQTHALETVSPLATLNRGYAIVQTEDGRVVREAGEVEIGQRVQARLGKGRLQCRVEERHLDEKVDKP